MFVVKFVFAFSLLNFLSSQSAPQTSKLTENPLKVEAGTEIHKFNIFELPVPSFDRSPFLEGFKQLVQNPRCDFGPTFANCSRAHITSLPTEITVDYEILHIDLSKNRIKTLSDTNESKNVPCQWSNEKSNFLFFI